MPNAADPSLTGSGVPLSHNPLQRLNFTPPKQDVDPIDVLDAVIQWVEDFLFPALEEITGIDLSPFLAELKTALTNLQTLFGSLNPASGTFDPIAVAAYFIENALKPTGLVLGQDSPLNAANLIGTIRGALFGAMPIGNLTDEQPNVLPDGGIFGIDSLAPSTDWFVDPNASRTADGSGSATVLADGRFHALRSGSNPADVIALGKGQTLATSLFCSCSGYSGVGDDPILLQLVPFTNSVPGTPVTLDSWAPIAADVAWPGHELKGSYPVPDGVDGAQLRILITDGALAGTLRFDDAKAVRTTLIQKSWIQGLEDDLTGFQQQVFGTWDAITSAAKGIPVFGSGLAELEDAIKNFNPGNIAGPLGQTTIGADMQQIVNLLVGGLRGKPVTGNANLADIYSAASQASTNVPGSDVTTNLDVSGSFPINSWATWLDLVGVGRGQDGEDGTSNPIPGFFGQGGSPGRWNATTWQRGVHFDSGVTAVNFTVNPDGSITFSIPAGTATPAQQMTCLPGSGVQSPHLGSGWQGIGPKTFVYNGGNFVGGDTQNMPGAAGLGPGGGGAGGLGILLQPGGKGAGPRGWLRQRANTVPNQSTGADTTAPTGGSGDFISATLTSVRIGAHGSVDA